MNYYGWHMIRPVSPFMGFTWVLGLIFWIFVFLLIVAIVRGLSDGHGDKNDDSEENPDRALNILKERYAKGELTKRDFDRMKKEIA